MNAMIDALQQPPLAFGKPSRGELETAFCLELPRALTRPPPPV
jgi:hypothetical protein